MNTVAYDIFVLVFAGAAAAVLAWGLVDGLRTGRIALRYGGWAVREKQPLGYWFLIGLMMTLLIGCCIGLGATMVDLFVR